MDLSRAIEERTAETLGRQLLRILELEASLAFTVQEKRRLEVELAKLQAAEPAQKELHPHHE